MDDFTISLAGVPIGIRPLCLGIQPFFSDFLSCEAPLFTVGATEEDLEYERMMSKKRNGEDYSRMAKKVLNLESSALLRMIADRMLAYDTILFHGAAVAVDGKAYLFAARSGTGKTTHIRLWLQQLPQACVLNGDKPFLKVDGSGRVLVCGTPWTGKEKYGCNKILPLEAVCLLERATDNHICSVRPKEASQALLHQVHFPEDAAAMLRAIQSLDRITAGTRLFRLGCNMDPEAAQVSIRAMIPDRTKDAHLPAKGAS